MSSRGSNGLETLALGAGIIMLPLYALWEVLPYILIAVVVIAIIVGIVFLVRFFIKRKRNSSNSPKTETNSERRVSEISIGREIKTDSNPQNTILNGNSSLERKDRTLSKEDRLEELYSDILKYKGASFRYQQQKICIQTSADADIQDLMCLGRQMNRSINSSNQIIYEIYDKKQKLALTILYEEKTLKSSIVFCCSLDFINESIPTKTIKDEFFSNCCIITKNIVFCYLQNRQIENVEKTWSSIIEYGIKNVPKLTKSLLNVEEIVSYLLNKSDYNALFKKEIALHYEDNTIIINYLLPNKEDFLQTKEYKYNSKTKKIEQKSYTEATVAKMYEKALYSICLRSIYEIFTSVDENKLSNIVFNGFVNHINRSTGQRENKYILSISVNRSRFNELDLEEADPKLCFKALKGVSAAKIVDIVAITPVLTFDKNDKRLIENKSVSIDVGTNLAIMDWADFEHLVRDLFEKEFYKSGGEVRVTQASRDGGVDAIVYDPDPIRGGKIVIQAKRYTNTVSVSAVRDLYGTVINEGANSGILITTSDYGGDSYEFAKNKPLKLLNGGHLLSLLEKHGKKGYIDIKEAKKIEQ